MKVTARRTLLLLGALVLYTVSVLAQGTTNAVAQDGRMIYTMNSAVAQAVQAQGIHYGFGNYIAPTSTDPGGYKTAFGHFEDGTGFGEVALCGEFQFQAGTLTMDLRNMTYQTTLTGQVLTAAVFLNNVFQGRQVVFDFLNGNAFAGSHVGPWQSGINTYVMDPAFLLEFVKFFQVPQLAPILNSTYMGWVTFRLTLEASGVVKY